MPNSVESILITGASSGIGKSLALEWAKRGARLGLLARRSAELEQVAKRCLELGAEKAEWSEADVKKPEDFLKALTELDESLGGITIFVANAGVHILKKTRENQFEAIRETFEINTLGAIRGLEWMKVKMIQRGFGTLVGISSIAALRGLPGSTGYSASKAALSSYLESLRVELGPLGVKVVTIEPGYVETAMTARHDGRAPGMISSEVFASRIVRRMERGDTHLIEPTLFWWLGWVLRLLPRWLFDRLTRKYVLRVERDGKRIS
jgi:short-subunit dehydrogenase